MSEIQSVINSMWLTMRGYEHAIPIDDVERWANDLERLLQQQTPSAADGQQSEVNRDVQSAAHIVAQLRARAKDSIKEAREFLHGSGRDRLDRLHDITVGEMLSCHKLIEWLDELSACDAKEAANTTDVLADAAD